MFSHLSARDAVDSLQSGGLSPLNMSLLGAEARDAASGDRMPSRLLHRAALGGLVGSGLGALIGLLIASLGLTFAPGLDKFGVQAAAYAFFGFDAGTFIAVMAGAELVGPRHVADAPESGASPEMLVSVHSQDQAQIDHAEKLLRGQTPARVERFIGDSPPPAVLAQAR